MINYTRKAKQEKGSMLVTGLMALALMVVPMIMIIVSANRLTTASVTANGLAAMQANAAFNRSYDNKATQDNDQLQLFSPASVEAKDASSEIKAQTITAWNATGINGKAGWGDDIRLQFGQTSSNGRPAAGNDIPNLKAPGKANLEPAKSIITGLNSSQPLVMNIINLPGNVTENYLATSANKDNIDPASRADSACVRMTGFNPTNPNASGTSYQYGNGVVYQRSGTTAPWEPSCWVDHKILSLDSRYQPFSPLYNGTPDLGKRNSSGWGGRPGQYNWDHYSTGVETLLGFSMGLPFAGSNSKATIYYPGVATVGQPCDPSIRDKCNQ